MGKWKLRLAAVVWCVFAASGALDARDKKTKSTLYLDTRDVLQIEYRVSIDPKLQMNSPSLADSTRDLKRRWFSEALMPTLELAKLPITCAVLGEREDPEKGQPVLRLHAIRWEQGLAGEIEAVLQMNLHAYGYRQKIGVYRSREYPPGVASTSLEERAYVDSMRENLQKAFYDLLLNFEEPPDGPSDE